MLLLLRNAKSRIKKKRPCIQRKRIVMHHFECIHIATIRVYFVLHLLNLHSIYATNKVFVQTVDKSNSSNK